MMNEPAGVFLFPKMKLMVLIESEIYSMRKI